MEWGWHKSTYDQEGSMVPHYRDFVYSLNWRIIAESLIEAAFVTGSRRATRCLCVTGNLEVIASSLLN
jgi:hypothetical protein